MTIKNHCDFEKYDKLLPLLHFLCIAYLLATICLLSLFKFLELVTQELLLKLSSRPTGNLFSGIHFHRNVCDVSMSNHLYGDCAFSANVYCRIFTPNMFCPFYSQIFWIHFRYNQTWTFQHWNEL